MTVALVTAISNVATLLVLSCAAVAAIVQLRYVRAGKELQAVLAVDAGFAESRLQSALLYVQTELPNKLTERDYRAQLAARGYVDPHTHPEMLVCNWFNEMGTMIAGGFLNEDVFFDSFGRLVEHYWRLLAPAIALLRRDRGAHQYASFERLARRAADWREQHRNGGYPAGVARLPVFDLWAERDGLGDASVPQA